jgi:hypothetical protein
MATGMIPAWGIQPDQASPSRLSGFSAFTPMLPPPAAP